MKTKPPSGKSIIYIINSIPADTQIGQAMAEAAKATGWSYSAINYDPSNPATVQQAFASALVKRPTVVAIGGVAPDLFGAGTLSNYAKAGIPIIAASTYPVHTTKTLLGTPNSIANPSEAGSLIAKWFISDSKAKGSALLVHVSAFPLLSGFETAFDSEMKSKCAGCSATTVNITAPELAAGQIAPRVVSYLQAHQGIHYVFFDLGNWADGIQSALAAAGLSHVKVGGQGMDVDGSAGLKQKTEAVWTATSNYYTGYAIMDFAFRHLEGLTTTGDETSPIQLFTPANIGTVTNWNAPYNALAQFEHLWKVPVTKCTVACS